MQTHHVPMSLCNSTFVMQFEDRVPAALGRIEPQRFSTTVTQLNRMIVDGTPRKLVLGFLITMLLLTVMVIVFTSVGYPMAIYVHIALVFVLTIPYGIYAFRCQTKLRNDITEFLASENMFYQPNYGVSWVYHTWATCGDSHLQIVDCSAVQTIPNVTSSMYSTVPQVPQVYATSGYVQPQVQYATAMPTYVAQTAYTPLTPQPTVGYY